MVVVVGDVNSTMACTIAASKVVYTDLPEGSRRPVVAHLEAGMRSNDRTIPEQINRLITDSLAGILWSPSPDATENFLKKGVPRQKVENIGNIMIDSLEMMREKIVAA